MVQVLIKSKYDDQKERLWQHTKDLPRGTVVTHEEMAKLIGFRYGTAPYRTIKLAWAKQMKKERSIEVMPAQPYGTGWRLSTAEEQVIQNPNSHRRRAGRIIKRTVETVAIAPTLELSDHAQRVQSQTLIQLEDEVAMMRNNSRKMKCLQANPSTMPRLAVG